MARQARKKSGSGFYHVILRGIGKQVLFEEDRDYLRFLDTVKRYVHEQEVQLHAYCLMENHVHLLVRDGHGALDSFMKKVEGSYAFYFNHKYERIGALFQDRYKSEPIEDDAYFAAALRYILQNPQKAGIGAVDTYPWNSYREHFSEPEIIRNDFAFDFFGGKEKMLQYIRESNEDSFLEPSAAPVGDSRARAILQECLQVDNGMALQTWERTERDRALRTLKENGLSIRQIERLTGISRGIVQKA